MPIAAAMNVKDVKWKIWEKTEKYTVDDGFLAGAGLGLGVGIVSSLVMRRSPLRWWTRCMGMTNIGAFTGIAGSNAYFQYTGDRQNATQVLDQWRKRRNIEFHHLYWKRLVFTTLSLPIQAYIMFNGVFRASNLPEEVADFPEKYGYNNIVDPWATPTTTESAESTPTKPTTEPAATPAPTGTETETQTPTRPLEQNYYFASEDYAKTLQTLDIQEFQRTKEDRVQKRETLLKEADHLAYQVCQKEYDLLHKKFSAEEEDERQLLLREISLLMVLYNRLREDADVQGRAIHFARMALQHRAVLDYSTAANITSSSSSTSSPSPSATSEPSDPMESWYPQPYIPSLVKFDHPHFSLQECNIIRDGFLANIEAFEQQLDKALTAAEKEQALKNLEEGRMLLRAADRVFFRLGRLEKAGKEAEKVEEVVQEQGAKAKVAGQVEKAEGKAKGKEKLEGKGKEKLEVVEDREKEKVQVEEPDKEKVEKVEKVEKEVRDGAPKVKVTAEKKKMAPGTAEPEKR
jgi:hypothetical protein